MQPHDELEALPNTVSLHLNRRARAPHRLMRWMRSLWPSSRIIHLTFTLQVPCTMCQLEAAPQVLTSVARCLTCRDTVCLTHLKAHNAAHKGLGHKVFFLSNQNLAQFAQNAADADSVSCPPPAPPAKTAPTSPEVHVASALPPPAALAVAAAAPSPTSPSTNETTDTSYTNPLSPSLQWREPVGHWSSSADADMPWAAADLSQTSWSGLAWNDHSSLAADGSSSTQTSPLFVGERAVRSGSGFAGGLW